MSQHLPVLSSKDVIRRFQAAGWEVVPSRGKGSHTVMASAGSSTILTIPKANPVRRGTLRSLIRSAGLSVQEFNELG